MARTGVAERRPDSRKAHSITHKGWAMFISVIHRISGPDAFWATASSAAKDIPADTKLHKP
jgi:hypothetical protein